MFQQPMKQLAIDVRKFLERQKQLVTVGLGIPVSFVVENQQSFSRMVWLKRMESGSHDSIIPLPGDFHAAVHMLMALHILLWALWNAGWSRAQAFARQQLLSLGVAWSFFNVTVFLNETIIVDILAYILEAAPHNFIEQPSILLQFAKGNNKGVVCQITVSIFCRSQCCYYRYSFCVCVCLRSRSPTLLPLRLCFAMA